MTTARILCGDVRAVLPTLAESSVQCVVTSPPYWGLRDYGHAEQIGLERTPQEYVAKMVAVFREVRRVLRDDGVLWLNLGDCYATGAGAVGDCPGGGEQGARWAGSASETRGPRQPAVNGRGEPQQERTRALRDGTHAGKHTAIAAMGPMSQPNRMPQPGLKPKDLVGIPWRAAFALQEDGWYLRSDCIWAKPNPMPESVTDRPTKAHEYLFLLTKSERYFYDADAILEPLAEASAARYLYAFGGAKNEALKAGDNPTAVVGMRDVTDGRNKRTVWTIATQPYSGAHFAVMPEALAEPCILAGTSEKGACAKCGAPWARDVAVDGDTARDRANERGFSEKADGARVFTPQGLNYAGGHGGNARERRTVGWSSSCDCGEQETRPCVVLDPFAGSGTVGVVALKRGRSFLGVELNPKYAAMARDRIHDDAPLLNVVDAPRAGVVPPTPRASPPGGEEDTRCA